MLSLLHCARSRVHDWLPDLQEVQEMMSSSTFFHYFFKSLVLFFVFLLSELRFISIVI
jgi:hypothetical protein